MGEMFRVWRASERGNAKGTFGDGFEPAVVGFVIRTKWHKLGEDNDTALPERGAIFAEDLGEIFLLDLVGIGENRWEVVVFREDADTEVVIAGEVGVVRHGGEKGKQPLERFWTVQVHGLDATGPFVVLVTVHLDSEVGDDGQVARRATEDGVEQLWMTLARDLPEFTIVLDDLEGHDVVPKEAERATKLAIATSLDVAAEMDVFALPVGDEDLALAHPFVELNQIP